VHEVVIGSTRAAPTGQQWVSVDVTLENVGPLEEISQNSLYFRIRTADNREYEAEAVAVLRPDLVLADLHVGDISRGWVSFLLPKDASLAALTYAPAGNGDKNAYIVFDLR
jgi:hypothetical protein